jgi:hypothetical protein
MPLYHFQRLLQHERHGLNTVAHDESRKLPPVTSSTKGTSLVQITMKGGETGVLYECETWLLTQRKDAENRALNTSLRS